MVVKQSLGAMAAGGATPSTTAGKSAASGYNFGSAASAGNVVGDVPYNTNWKPYATPTEYNPFKPYSMTTNDWITNPNQFRP